MNYLLLLLAVFVGFALPIQGAIGARLGALLPDPMYSVTISYAGGLLTCLVVLLLQQTPAPQLQDLQKIDWYLFLPGLLGAIFVSSMIFLIPHIGVANMLVAAIVGQLILSMLLDHYGAFGNPEIKINSVRVLGGVLLLAGLLCLQYTPSEEQQTAQVTAEK